MTTALTNTALKNDSKLCALLGRPGLIDYKLRFFVMFCLVFDSLITSCKGLYKMIVVNNTTYTQYGRLIAFLPNRPLGSTGMDAEPVDQ